jgi:glycosyltransferase involved in cell wall biosynthesis
LAYDVDFNRETTQNKVIFFNDIKQLQDNIELLLNNKTLRKKIVQDVKKLALEKYNWNKIINKYENIL